MFQFLFFVFLLNVECPTAVCQSQKLFACHTPAHQFFVDDIQFSGNTIQSVEELIDPVDPVLFYAFIFYPFTHFLVF